LDVEGRVAIVTGGGRGLGRPYAMLLASRGAKVVVNDPGGGLTGDGSDAAPAGDVVHEITAAGGQAVASTDSVATAAGGKAIVEAALDTYGRVDILIHKAGNVRRGSLKEMSYEDFDAVLDVHLRGAFNVARPAFVHKRAFTQPSPQPGVHWSKDVRFDKIAEGFGCHGEYVEKEEGIGPAIERAYASGKTAVVHVCIDPKANSEEMPHCGEFRTWYAEGTQ
jgi:NAD(P)-dependent dehydrogenase (short-subunit alcohol dehydrogenase family)